MASFGPERDGKTFRGREEVRRGFEALNETYPDIHYGDLKVILDGDGAAAGWTMTGTDSRSGERVMVRGCDLFELADGKVVRKVPAGRGHVAAKRSGHLGRARGRDRERRDGITSERARRRGRTGT